MSLTSEELEILESAEKVLHDSGDVLLEVVDLAGAVVLLEVLDHLLHVVLEVHGEVLLGPEAGLHEPVVEDDVDAGGGGLVCAFVGLLGGSVGSLQDDIVALAGLVLQMKKSTFYIYPPL